MACRFALALALLTACDATYPVYVDLRTDLVPGAELDSVALTVDGAAIDPHVVGEGDYLAGVRVAELGGIAPGTHRIVASLQRNGEEVIAREVIFEVRVATSVTLVVTRDCRGVVCPADDASATACLGGHCVEPTCTPETPEACPVPECVADVDCPSAVSCASGICAGGACLFRDDGICAPGQVCDGALGCVRPDGCTTWGPWSTPTELTELDTSDVEWGAWISPDATEIWFASTRAGQLDIYRALRNETSSAFGAPELVDALSTGVEEDDIELTADRLEVYFGRGDPSALFVSRRDRTNDPFGEPVRLALNVPAQLHVEAALRGDELELIYTTATATSIGFRTSTRPSRESDFGPGTDLPELDAAGRDQCCPTLSADGLELYFQRTGDSPEMDNDIYRAVRTSPSDPFDPPEVVRELSIAGDHDADATLSRDGTTMVIASQRPGGAGDFDLYLSTRSCQD